MKQNYVSLYHQLRKIAVKMSQVPIIVYQRKLYESRQMMYHFNINMWQAPRYDE